MNSQYEINALGIDTPKVPRLLSGSKSTGRCEACGEVWTYGPWIWPAIEIKRNKFVTMLRKILNVKSNAEKPTVREDVCFYSCRNGCYICPCCERTLRNDDNCGCWRCACRWGKWCPSFNKKGEPCGMCGCAEGRCACTTTQ